jgi:hypothetical protein
MLYCPKYALPQRSIPLISDTDVSVRINHAAKAQI